MGSFSRVRRDSRSAETIPEEFYQRCLPDTPSTNKHVQSGLEVDIQPTKKPLLHLYSLYLVRHLVLPSPSRRKPRHILRQKAVALELASL
jgi:hypothetical protein